MTHRDHSRTPLCIADADWFRTPEVAALFAALNRDGHETRIVGGAVRNTLMRLPAGDVDFATTAPPEEVMRFATEAGLKAVGTGLKHGTVTVVVRGEPFEVTTLREDVETHGRHATVQFTSDWESDARRRDFTMNALYADAEGRVFDPLGGYADLRAGRVNFIGVAHERIREDYLRILRFFRFTAEYGEGKLDRVGFHAAISERAGIARLSAERIHTELLRILTARVPIRALEPMADGGFLTGILGGVARLAHFERLVALEARHGLAPDAVRRLGALALMVEEDVARLVTRLRLSNAEAARLAAMAAYRPVCVRNLGEDSAREQLYRLGEGAFRDRVLIAWARSGDDAGDAAWWRLFTLPDRWRAPKFPITGQDMMALGIKTGPKVGAAMRALETRWIASGFALGRAELLAMAEAERA